MNILKKLFELIKAILYLPIHISRISKGTEDLVRIENKLDSLTQKFLSLDIDHKFDSQFLQLESLLSLYKILPNLKLLPATRGWAGSPDFLLKIAEVVLKERPGLVLEASSGVSTIVVGLALKLNNYGKAISLDHDNYYAELTRKYVGINCVEDVSEVKFCPLYEYSDIEKYEKWYETSNLNLTQKIDLLVIDGPPRSTQFLARYPAVPILHEHFADRTLILLDDASRNDESITVQKWMDFLERNNFVTTLTQFTNFEKGMAMLEVRRILPYSNS